MAESPNHNSESLQIAQRWCASQGPGWHAGTPLGKGGTAPVFEVISPRGPRALKIYDARFSSGEQGEIEYKRLEYQLALKGHDCPYLVQIFDGGRVEGRLFLLMGRAPGTELEKRLRDIPREKIRTIVDQVTRAAIFLKGRGLCHRDIKAANIFISDGFDHCTLLDISVIRDVNDPIGVGTDHNGHLPVVATARYSPPEYLFRLLQPGPDLWHALNVYQLGALLHDLIMREPLFEAEYLQSVDNRYRFAWIVATADPHVHANDADRDLILIARRALDKNWQRRSALSLESFLADATIQRANALQVLGVGIDRGSLQQTEDPTLHFQRVSQVANELKDAFTADLRTNGVTAYHDVRPASHDTSRLIVFQWTAPAELQARSQIDVQVDLHLLAQGNVLRFGVSLTLATKQDTKDRALTIALPDLQDDVTVGQRLLSNIIAAFEQLAVDITRADATTRDE